MKRLLKEQGGALFLPCMKMDGLLERLKMDGTTLQTFKFIDNRRSMGVEKVLQDFITKN